MAENFDFEAGFDPTALANISAAQLLQMVNQIRPNADRGGVVFDSSPPDVTGANEKYKRYVWIDTTTTPYVWKLYNPDTPGWEAALFTPGALSGGYITDASVTIAKLSPSGGTALQAIRLNSGGTAYEFYDASTSVPDGSIGEDQLGTGAVTTTKIGPLAVDSTKLANSAVTNDKLNAGAVTADKCTPGAYWCVAGTESSNNYTVPLSPAISGYADGLTVKFIPSAGNTGNVTIDVNSKGVKSLKRPGGQQLEAGAIRAGKPVECIYAGGTFYLLGESANYQPMVFGTTGGTSTTYTFTTPSNFAPMTQLFHGAMIRVKFDKECGATPTLAVDGLTAKAVRTPTDTALAAGQILINSIYELVYDSTANSPAGAWLIASGTICSGLITIPASNANTSFAHGLGRTPTGLRLVIVRTASGEEPGVSSTAAELFQYDELDATALYLNWGTSQQSPSFQMKASSTAITVYRTGNGTNDTPYLMYQTDGHVALEGNTNATFVANYKLKLYYS